MYVFMSGQVFNGLSSVLSHFTAISLVPRAEDEDHRLPRIAVRYQVFFRSWTTFYSCFPAKRVRHFFNNNEETVMTMYNR